MTPPRRGLVKLVRVSLVLLAVSYGAWWTYDYAFQPGEIRRRVLEALSDKFDGVDVELGSAHMRPFLGGVNITELKLIRRDDPTRTPFLHVPKATIWFDKSLALQKLPLGKIELDDSHIRLIRDREGGWNVEGLMHPAKKDSGPAPVLVLKKARVSIVDHQKGLSGELNIRETDLTVVNDPETLFTIEASGEADPFGKFHIKGKYETNVGAIGQLDLPQATMGASLNKLLAMFKPEAADMIAGLDGKVGVNLKWDWKVHQPWIQGLDAQLNFSNVNFHHPELKVAISDVSAKVRFRDGELRAEPIGGKLAGASFKIKLDMDFKDLLSKEVKADEILSTIETRIRKLDVNLSDLQIGPDLFAILPEDFQEVQRDYLPKGLADIQFEQRRDGERTTRKALLRPKGMSAMYEGFAYPVHEIRGTVEGIFNPDQPTKLLFDLTGEASGQVVSLKGRVTPGKNRDVDLLISGTSVALDQQLIKALPGTIPNFVDSLRATAKGDFTAKIRHNERIRKEHGPEVMDNEFDIHIHDGTLKYDEFPYPLKHLRGQLLIRTVPDYPTIKSQGPNLPSIASEVEIGSLVFRNFHAIGPNGAKLKLSGSKVPEPGGMLLSLDASVENMYLSGELQKAVTKIEMDKAWNTFDPSGRMNCNIEVRIHDRCPPGMTQPCPFVPSRDLELGLSFNGATICPKFFPYTLTDLAGRVKFAQSRVEIRDMRGMHGPTEISLSSAEIRLPSTGGTWAELTDLKMNPIISDREFLSALPKGLKSAWEGIEFTGPVSVHAKRLVFDDQTKGPPANQKLPQVAAVTPVTARGTMATTNWSSLPTTYWDATLSFQNASFKTGVTWERATGQLGTRGLFMGDKLGRVVANLAIDQALLFKQPVELVSAHLDVDPAKPDVLLVPWIKGKIYGGEIGGQARIEMGTPLKFDLSLSGTRLKLEEIARVNKLGPKTSLTGLATARINLSNPVDERTRIPTLEGEGSFDIPNGKLLDLPVILDVIKLARLRPMDQTMFEEAHAVFRIKGNRMKFNQLDLIGNAFSLGGDGEMNLDGTNAGFEFYTVWTNLRDFLWGTGEIPARLSSNLYKIKVSGNLGDDKPKVEQVPLPVVMEPVRRLWDRVNRNR